MKDIVSIVRRPYDILFALFVMTLIVSNIVSVKIVQVGAIAFDAGTILFPVAYIVGDIITEVYGFHRMRRLILISTIMLILTTVTIALVGVLPAAAEWGMQEDYNTILGVTGRIIAASLVAITVGELLNSYVLDRLKARTGGRYLWMRLMSSSVAGNAIDTSLFTIIAFAGTLPASVLLNIVVTVFCVKMVVEVAVSPLTMRLIGMITRQQTTV